ncbi:uncharacterized protein N7469_007216 [Penicillium citrinum]|uniref:Uncharacterized protein n=2 Tax=Penicillium TaxID=5073 RepID=A0A9W9TN36_PENCI|nr:uncharacterized protein N7469_007216 [Penicillium citrinum]KAJ5227210.1 hypothetical protein N7469_007216 [Penicillium citrinum]KAJ5568325.1 hypothetical protein N7450_010811 [Penicillium hetheringtonii]
MYLKGSPYHVARARNRKSKLVASPSQSSQQQNNPVTRYAKNLSESTSQSREGKHLELSNDMNDPPPPYSEFPPSAGNTNITNSAKPQPDLKADARPANTR